MSAGPGRLVSRDTSQCPSSCTHSHLNSEPWVQLRLSPTTVTSCCEGSPVFTMVQERLCANWAPSAFLGLSAAMAHQGVVLLLIPSFDPVFLTQTKPSGRWFPKLFLFLCRNCIKKKTHSKLQYVNEIKDLGSRSTPTLENQLLIAREWKHGNRTRDDSFL